MFDRQDVSDQGLRLEPITLGHIRELELVAFDASIWDRFVIKIETKEDLLILVHEAIKRSGVTYVIRLENSNTVIGMTSIFNISEIDSRAEIGWSWLAPLYQGKGYNAIIKNLLLSICFDLHNLERVEFKTDKTNIKSRKALLKIGAHEEGVLRSHTLMHDGRRRDTAYFSILKEEWPMASRKLQEIMKSYNYG